MCTYMLNLISLQVYSIFFTLYLIIFFFMERLNIFWIAVT